MAGTRNKTIRGSAAKGRTERRATGGRYGIVEGSRGGEAAKKKNLRLHQSKINEARQILGTTTETETIEAALDLVIFRKELVDGVRAMRGAKLVNLFAGVER